MKHLKGQAENKTEIKVNDVVIGVNGEMLELGADVTELVQAVSKHKRPVMINFERKTGFLFVCFYFIF